MSDQSTQTKLPAAELKQLTRRSDAKGLKQLLVHLCLMLSAAIALAVSGDGFWFWLALFIYGAIFTFLFAPLHETIHYTAFKARWLNDLVAALIGFFLFIPFQYFRAFHYAHHRHTQNPQLDPELIDKKPITRWGYIAHVSGLPIWYSNLKSVYLHARGDVCESYIETAKQPAIISEARTHLSLYCLLLLFSVLSANTLLWWFWILPLLLTQPLLRLFLLAEHTGCDLSDNMLENSRTTYTSRLVLLLSWNMPYHAEHHYMASVPFHSLPALHAFTKDSVTHKGAGYLTVNRGIYRQLADEKAAVD